MLHSCGAIGKAIPDLIDAGIDALHPLQARAKGMDAQTLSQYKNDILFVGGIDTQQILPFGTPGQVRDEVKRVRSILGPGLIVSPSHEALLPNVSPENLEAMYLAATEE
jgi:uroporphyrinogen decarboxylase